MATILTTDFSLSDRREIEATYWDIASCVDLFCAFDKSL